MAATGNINTGHEHIATAKALNIPVSTKHCVEICRSLRYKNTNFAKKYLSEVAALKRAVPYRRFNRTPHRRGMAAGRYPQKAAKEILNLIKSVEANAQIKGLNTADLKITKLIANKASIPLTGGRRRTGTKMTHVEVEVKEHLMGKSTGAVKKKAEIPKLESKLEKPIEKAVTSSPSAKKLPAFKVQEEINPILLKSTPISSARARMTEKVVDGVYPKQSKELSNSRIDIQIDDTSTKPWAESNTNVIVDRTAEKPVSKLREDIEDISPAELLKRAQEKAAILNRKVKEDRKVEEVSKLYEELQKKGSLRVKSNKK